MNVSNWDFSTNSCSWPFQVEFDRLYKVGSELVRFPQKVIVQLTNWNEYPKRESIFHDKRFEKAVLYVCAKKRCAKNDIRDEEMQFVTGK